MENISEEEVRIINELFVARQKVEIDRQNKNLGVAKGMGLHTKSLLHTSTSSKQRKKRGRRSNNEALQELGQLLLNSSKMKALEAFSLNH